VITRFNAPKRGAAGKGSIGDYSGRQTPTATGVADIQPNLAEGPPYGNRRMMGGGQDGTFIFLYLGLM
jgi:hypothetical protein